MASNENQGLQIALIIFVMLTIVLSVTTFLFYRQYEEADTKAKTDRASLDKKDDEVRVTLDEKNELKKYLGFEATDDRAKVEKAFNDDVSVYAAGLVEKDRNYRTMLQRLKATFDTKSDNLKDQESMNAGLKAKIAELEMIKEAQIDKYKADTEKHAQDLAAERKKFEDERQLKNQAEQDLKTKLDAEKADKDKQLAVLGKEVKTTKDDLKKVESVRKEATAKIDELTRHDFEVPDGKITLVSQQNRTVWINLGQAEALRRQINFSVYAAGDMSMTKKAPKAKIEVTQILGQHLAEARIIEDDLKNPILPGDKVYTPLWHPGRKEHFALAGLMDVDGDGKSDRELIRSLITLNGGVIDAEVKDDGTRAGEPTVNTRYFVRGDQPTEKTAQELVANFTWMTGECDKLSVETISLEKFLNLVGWKDTGKVVKFGESKSLTTGSGTFKPRRPIRAGGVSAF
ncbi:MAG: hypothetical protein ACYC35_07310 [Pirellulales bacterium]